MKDGTRVFDLPQVRARLATSLTRQALSALGCRPKSGSR
jgi:hypothetical protein